MADFDYMHIAAIMNAAMPYVNIKSRTPMNLIATLFAFMESMQSFRQPPDLTACGYDDQQMNMEGLLNAIRPHCNEKEQPIVDQILGALNAKRMFDLYNTYMDLTKSMGGFETGDAADETTYHAASEETSTPASTEEAINYAATEGTIDLTAAEEAIDSAAANAAESFHTDAPDTPIPEGSNHIMEMLKSMIPPEQMDTFANLSMLFNSTSYDNNNNAEQT